jgi:guanylate kinase
MLILSSPPGGGKTTISREIMARDPETTVSISATTRAMRPGEIDGTHYHFVNEAKFQEMVAEGNMLEHAFVYNNYHYGTPKAPVEAALSQGKDLLFDIDWQGTRSLKQTMPNDVVTVFILPPSWETLCDRLHGRAQDSEEEIMRRLSKASDEIAHYREFDYVVTNKDLEESIQAVWSILRSERMKRHRQPDLDAFVTTLKP